MDIVRYKRKKCQNAKTAHHACIAFCRHTATRLRKGAFVVTLAVWMHWALNCMASACTLLAHYFCQTDEVCNARREPRLRLTAEMILNSDLHCDGKSRTKSTTMRNSRVNRKFVHCNFGWRSIVWWVYNAYSTRVANWTLAFQPRIRQHWWLFPLHVAAVILLGKSRLSSNQLRQASKAKYVILTQD